MRDFRWDIVQQTEPWYQIKLGKISSTDAATLLVKGRSESGLGGGALKVCKRIATEIITGESASSFTGSKSTDRGNYLEPEARDAYQRKTFQKVHEIGFVQLNNLVGCSTDGILKNAFDNGEVKDGITEIKCYEGVKYLEMLDKGIKEEVKGVSPQMNFGMMVTGFDFCDFIMYHPKFPSKTGQVIKRVYRDEEMIERFITQIEAVRIEVNRLLELAGYHERIEKEIIELNSPDFVELKKVA